MNVNLTISLIGEMSSNGADAVGIFMGLAILAFALR